ncbi:SWIM zinc finger family protein [Thermodesulfatator atlanticus]
MKVNAFLKEVPSQIIERAKDILNKDDLLSFKVKDGIVKATVKGNYAPFYKVEVELKDQEIIDWYCSCPYNGSVCKHVVAVVLKAFNDDFLSTEAKKATKKRKRKTKAELAEEILEKLSCEELREFVREGIRYSKEWRNALLARFAFYADPGGKTLEAKYNAIFRHLVSSYKKHGFIDYYATMELEREVGKLLLTAGKLINAGKLEEACAIAKSVLSGWVKNLQNMDDSAGSTGNVVSEVLEIFKLLYSGGKKEVMDYLLKEGKKKDYRDFDIHYEIADSMAEVIDSQEAAKKLLAFVDNLKYGETIKAKILLKFFPEKYEEFVNANITDFSLADFHLEELIKREDYKEALKFVERVLSSKTPNKFHFFTKKAFILEKLGRKKEALKIYYSFFTTAPSLNFLWDMKKLASPDEWEKLKREAKNLLKGQELLTFLLKEGDFSAWLDTLKKEKERVGKFPDTFLNVVGMLEELPHEIAKEAAKTLLEVSHLMLETYNPNRRLYREFIRSIYPLKDYLGKETIKAHLEEVIQTYPPRHALKDEIQKYLSKIDR